MAERTDHRHQHGVTPFRHSASELVLRPGTPPWQSARVYNPTAIVVRNRVVLLYRAQGSARIRTGRHWRWPSVLGLAWSRDGLRFTPEPHPVLEPETPAERSGVEDPRVVKIGRDYVLTYTAFDGNRARLCLTTTRDHGLHAWDHRRVLFPRERRWTKAGALLPTKLRDQYTLYFQMHAFHAPPRETHIWLATSRNLRTWKIFPRPVLTARRGHFDDRLVEPGPPPLLLPEGILLLYNAARSSRNVQRRTFAVGWALFDRHDPSQVIERCEEPLLQTEHGPEQRGRVPRVPFRTQLSQHGRVPGTIFAEGLVYFRGAWRLYYGMGDTMIGVASARGPRLFLEATWKRRRRPRQNRDTSKPVFFFTDEDPEHVQIPAIE